MSAERPPANPLVLTLLTADALHRDRPTGKYTLLGIFTHIKMPKYPAQYPFFGVYLSVTDGYGPYKLHVRVVDTTADQTEVFGRDVTVEFKDPLHVVELGVAVGEMTFPRPGEYRVQVVCGGEVLKEHRLMAYQT